MRFEPLPIAGAFLIHTEPHADARGQFVRVYCEQAFAPLLPAGHWSQCNLSQTLHRGTVRGLHYQKMPAAEFKLVRPVSGSVWDVLVDLRRDSPTRCRWHAVTLRAGEQQQVLIPPGVAHGFQALSDDAQLLYFHSQPYRPDLEDGVSADDPMLDIAWPLPILHRSARDKSFAPLDAGFQGVTS